MEMRFKDFSYVRNVCFSEVPKILPCLPCDKKKKEKKEEPIEENESTNAEYIIDLREDHRR